MTPVIADSEGVYWGGGGNREVGRGKEEFSQGITKSNTKYFIVLPVKLLGIVPENLVYEMVGWNATWQTNK